MLDDVSNLSNLAKENQRLEKENARYEQVTAEINYRLDIIADKTKVLSTFVGVKPVESKSLGDINDQSQRFNNEILDRQLPLNELKIEQLSATLEKVERLFNEKQEYLDQTPSIWPLISTEYGRITSKRGFRSDPFTGKRAFHHGIDISTDKGTPVVAPANGVVIEAKKAGTLGNLIRIDHGLNYITRYGHLSKFNVKKGQVIKRGDVIGYVGNTGKSTGPHLHYEVIYNGKDVDPKAYILNFKHNQPNWDFEVFKRNRR